MAVGWDLDLVKNAMKRTRLKKFHEDMARSVLQGQIKRKDRQRAPFIQIDVIRNHCKTCREEIRAAKNK